MTGIPVLHSRADTLAQTWENALDYVYRYGCDIPNQYEQTVSRDCSMSMTVEKPLKEPMITRCLPGGFEDLWHYYLEVCVGSRDHEIRDPNDPADTRWAYTYHDRLTNYDTINQLEAMIEGLYVAPFTRRVQAITWMPKVDINLADPPCLQSVWCRLSPRSDTGGYWLNMNTRWRSRDAYRAAFMNMFVMVELMRWLSSALTCRSGIDVAVGRYVDWSDSFHIYGSAMDDVRDRALPLLHSRSLEDRTFTYAQYTSFIFG